jgi:hypothetical protein
LGFGYKLVYPLDVATAGVGLQYAILTDGVTDWSFSAQLLTSLTDPGDPMTDTDWWIWFRELNQEFSYTESDLSTKVTAVDVEVTKLVAANSCMSLSLLAGVGYQKISQEMLDLEGTQYDAEVDSVYNFRLDTRCGTYDITYLKPQVGVVPRLVLGNGVSAELKGAVAMVHISDKDDHLLRHFTSESKGWGIGLTGRLALQYDFPAAANGRTPFVRLSGECTTLKADLEESMTWYGDDPIADGDETGMTIDDLPHDVRSTQCGLQLRIGMAF